MRSSARFRMELNRECLFVFVIYSLASAVVRVHIAKRTSENGIAYNGISVVLARYICSSGRDIANGLVSAAVTVFEFFGFCAVCKRHKLVSETNSEYRNFAHEYFYLFYAKYIFGGVAGTVGKHYSIGAKSENFLRFCR